MTYKEKLDMIRQYEADNNIPDDKRLKDKPRDIDIDIRYMEIIEIPKERLDEIWDSVWGETNDAESLEWRDELTESEERYVQLLDEAFDIGMNKLFEDIAKESHRRILVAIESTDDYYDTAFHSDFINADIQNSDGTYGQTRDYYRIVTIDDVTGRLTPYDNRTFVNSDSAKEAVTQNSQLQLIDYDSLVHTSYEKITELKKATQKTIENNKPKNTVVVNAFGGAGAGKTTAALSIAAELKKRGYITEYVPEYAKELILSNNFSALDGSLENQRKVYEEQRNRIERCLGKVDFIVTDCPIIISGMFLNDCPEKTDFQNEILEQFNKNTNFSFVIQRDENKFEQENRMGTFEEAKAMDSDIQQYLADNNIPFDCYDHTHLHTIVENSIKMLNGLGHNGISIANDESFIGAYDKKRLFVDMDGTLCRFHDEVGYLERMFEKGFFESLKPFDDFVYGLRLYMQANPKVEVYILSAAVDGEPPYCRAEKNDWIDQYLPEIDKEHRIFTKVGLDKSDFIPGGIRSTDYLYDDYNKNLEEWRASGGCAIKCKNNINHRGLVGELWNGDIIANEGNPMQICRDLEVKTEVVDITQRFAVFPIRSDEQPRLFDTSYEATLHSRRLEMRGIQSETSAMTQQEFDACTNAKLDVPVEEVPPIDIG